ncbi:MAG: hypothetical protein LBJ57_01095 [Prevotellaceae bacterium]|jgi:hypothetical protein|nr:hypothetical protein [Prevotellaceae bacterium]
MKRIFLTLSFAACTFALLGQEAPRWLDRAAREQAYPAGVFITGFASEMLRPGDDVAQAQERLKKEAQKNLSENIRLKIEGSTQTRDKSVQVGGKELITSTYDASVQTSSNVEITGVKTDAFFDSRKREVYAFAYANKYEVAGYYKASIAMLVQQAEGLLHTAEQLEQSGEKAKARKQCEALAPLLDKVRYAQDLLTAIDAASSDGLQQGRLEALHSKATQMQARLAQGVLVYVESREKLLGADVDIATGKVKAELALKGCSFVEEEAQADFRLRLNVSTRQLSSNGAIVFCYADAAVELYDVHKQKAVYTDNISQKGGSSSQDKAGRKALSDIASKISEKINPWVE